VSDGAQVTHVRRLPTSWEPAELLDLAPVLVRDLSHRILFWNAAAERLYGWSAQDAVGRLAHDLFQTRFPAPLEAIDAQLAAIGEWRGELVRTKADGSQVIVASHWVLRHDDQSGARAILEVANDVTAERQSDARHAAIVETALDAIVTIEADGRIIEFNPSAERMFGHRRQDVLGRNMAELLIPHALRGRHSRGFARYLDTGEASVLGRRMEMPALRADGSELLVELAIVRLSGEGPPRFTGHLRDLTDRQRADERRNVRLAVTQLLANATTLRETMPDLLRVVCEELGWDVGACWIWEPDGACLRCLDLWHAPSRNVEAFEQSSRRMTFGIGVGLPGRVWQSRAPHWVADVTRDDNFPRAPFAARNGLHSAFAFPILVGAEVFGVIEFFSRAIREPDADLLETMTTVAGQVCQLIGRERAQAAVYDSEERFALFMQHLPGLAWIKDLDGRYVYANDAAVSAFRTSRERLYGHTDTDVFPAETAAHFRENDRRAIESGSGVQMIETLRHEQRLRHSIVSKFLIPAPDGRQTLVGGIAIDITDRLGAEEALQLEARRKDEFLAMLAHELRNPLAPIANALQIMRQQAAGGQIGETFQEIALRQVEHMSRLLDDLLDVGRISQGRIELRKEPVDIGALVTRVVEATLSLFESRRHELTVSLPRGPVWVMGDPTRLEQVLTNLLNNAAKYTEVGGCVWLTAEREGDGIALRVRDTGIGIAPELTSRVFDLFMQAERRLDRSRGGIGVGLTLVKRLTELHGGRVEARSGGVGQGSEFSVWLPILQEAAADSGATKRSVPSPAFPVRRILVVDDNQDSASSLGMLLQLNGQQVRVAYDGPTALTIAAEFRPHLVLLDLGMPGMDGYEVARRVREGPVGASASLVALTGWGRDEDRRRTSESGFADHLTKPVRIEALHRLLAQPISRPADQAT
jgi:PAS domain S-box-containing protein